MKVSCILPVYNGDLYLKRTLESILNQTFTDFELIIVDDGSTDRTNEIIHSFKDPRIKYIKQEQSGKSNARNRGIQSSCGEFLVFHDADDVSMPNRFSILHRHLEDHPDVEFAHSDMLLIDHADHPIGYWSTNNITPDQYDRFFLRVGTPFNNGSMMVRKSAFKEELQDESLSLGEDTEFIDRALNKSHSIHIALPLLQYRRHSSNESVNTNHTGLFTHVRKIIDRRTIQELVPECSWNDAPEEECLCRAYALLFLFLLRRGFPKEGQSYFLQAKQYATTPPLKLFLFSIVHIASNQPMQAFKYLNHISPCDHIVHHYRGECYALLKDWNQAYDCFMKAIILRPDYEEPLHRLKGLGCGVGHHFIDPTYAIYKN
ncbi:glycosyltransferase [Halobacillus yeomjeoni]|uniref:Glycosyltransferase n=1 Tax=Halobacillus yeomjeoni TaxID=311194 RepID=A0A931HSM1_9BACI|nr:glycosyltransferase [Halobacillus yeomjeoni]MBH0228847.1 glycosyltransferase [Halobacillus yeomjeoni]